MVSRKVLGKLSNHFNPPTQKPITNSTPPPTSTPATAIHTSSTPPLTSSTHLNHHQVLKPNSGSCSTITPDFLKPHSTSSDHKRDTISSIRTMEDPFSRGSIVFETHKRTSSLYTTNYVSDNTSTGSPEPSLPPPHHQLSCFSSSDSISIPSTAQSSSFQPTPSLHIQLSRDLSNQSASPNPSHSQDQSSFTLEVLGQNSDRSTLKQIKSSSSLRSSNHKSSLNKKPKKHSLSFKSQPDHHPPSHTRSISLDKPDRVLDGFVDVSPPLPSSHSIDQPHPGNQQGGGGKLSLSIRSSPSSSSPSLSFTLNSGSRHWLSQAGRVNELVVYS